MGDGVGLVYDERYLQHDPGAYRLRASNELFPFAEPVPHPSNQVLVERTKHLLDLTGLTQRLVPLVGRLATDAELVAYHTPAYVARVQAVSAAGGGDAGRNARLAAGGETIARLAAGGVCAAVEAVMQGDVARAVALVRPPGHHAMADLGMGFCLYNNVVVAVRAAQRRWGLTRVLIVDWDVHHGNGIQDAFYADPSVLFISLHQDQLFPQGWGDWTEIGIEAGAGLTVNIPLPAGTGDAGYRAAFDQLVEPIACQYQPELIVVAAGQDASNADPLGRMCVTSDGFREMTARLMAIAAEQCDGRLVVAQEGGYAEWYAPYCTLAVIETLLGLRCGIEEPFPPAWMATMPPTRTVGLDASIMLDQARRVQQQFWRL